MILRWLRCTAVLGLAAGLSACIVSKELLFNPNDAVTPFSAGRYEVQTYDFQTWAWGRASLSTLELQGRNYVLTSKNEDDSENQQKFTVYDIGSGFLAAATLNKDDKDRGPEYYYQLLEKDGEEILSYEISCGTLVGSRLPDAYRPIVEGRKDSPEDTTYCRFSNREKLAGALLHFVRIMRPRVRYRLVKG
jgi:hypothetical protein